MKKEQREREMTEKELPEDQEIRKKTGKVHGKKGRFEQEQGKKKVTED